MKNTIISTLLVLVLSLIFVACGGSKGSSEGKVSESCGIYGQVTDYDTGAPLSNAKVELSGTEVTITGSDGYFEFRLTPPEPGTAYIGVLVVSKAGYKDFDGRRDGVTIGVQDRMVRFDVQLQKEE